MKFKSKIPLYIERDRFIIKTAEDYSDLEKVLRLRHDVFYKEILNEPKKSGIDKDQFDLKCDHLMVIEKSTSQVIGTYRLISSIFSKKFYSDSEFHFKDIKNLPGIKLELGRACVHKDYRTSSTIAMLWRGIAEYMKKTNTQYLFGCSSIMMTDPKEIANAYLTISSMGKWNSSFVVKPKIGYRIKRLRHIISQSDDSYKEFELPPLFKSYFNMGAYICGYPALDKKFKCVDFFTFFDLESSNKKAVQKYGL